MRHLIALLFALLAGCSVWTEKARAIKLEDLMNGYTQTMEWSDFSRALHYRKITTDRPPPDITPYQNIKISDYRPVGMIKSEDGKTVTRLVHVRYILLSRMAERDLTSQEVWTYSEEEGRWVIISDLPAFPQK